MIAAGSLDRRIIIETRSVTRAESGEEVESWATLATVWARVVPVGGREFYSAGGAQTAPAANNRFIVRWLSGVTAQARIQYDGKVWNIRNIAEIGRREGLELTAEAIAQ